MDDFFRRDIFHIRNHEIAAPISACRALPKFAKTVVEVLLQCHLGLQDKIEPISSCSCHASIEMHLRSELQHLPELPMIQLAIQDQSIAHTGGTDLSGAEAAIAATQTWLEKAVIGLNLCPFAKAVHVKKQIRYAVSGASTTDELLEDFISELQSLEQTDPAIRDTTLLIHPHVLADFLDYNEFLDIADATIAQFGLSGEIQIASFHPAYQFAGMPPDDISNFTNRSPFPILHLLREASIERAIEAFPDASKIYEKNIETLRHIGYQGWKELIATPLPLSKQKK